MWVCRHRELDLTTGFVRGAAAGLVVDTGADLVAGRALRADVAGLMGSAELPLSVVYTHAHFDHCFGTAAFSTPAVPEEPAPGNGASGRSAAVASPPVPVWAHERCAVELAVNGVRQRESVVAGLRGTGRDLAAELVAAVQPVLPTRTLATAAVISLGERDVQLLHLGRGHTDHDVVVLVPDVDVVFAGDLVEQGAPPAFEGSDPRAWPRTVRALLDALGPTASAATVVPGHGDPVDAAFVAAQQVELVAVAEACARGRTDGGPYPVEVMEQALAALRAVRAHP